MLLKKQTQLPSSRQVKSRAAAFLLSRLRVLFFFLFPTFGHQPKAISCDCLSATVCSPHHMILALSGISQVRVRAGRHSSPARRLESRLESVGIRVAWFDISEFLAKRSFYSKAVCKRREKGVRARRVKNESLVHSLTS